LELKASPSTSVNSHEIKQEPNLTLYNLVTSEPINNYLSQPLINNNSFNFAMNNTVTSIANQNQNMMYDNSLTNNINLFHNSQQHYKNQQQQQQQQYLQPQTLQQKQVFPTQNENEIFEQNFTSGLSVDDSKILEEILSSPMDFQQKDPMLSELNNFQNETFN